MLLEYDGEVFIFKEYTLQTIKYKEQNKNRLEILNVLLQDWTLEKELNFSNISKLKPFIIESIINKAEENYREITSINRSTLEGLISATFNSNKVNFNVVNKKQEELIKDSLFYAQSMFDHRGNFIHYPEKGG
ncbi:MAG: hypothetical protein ACQESN_11060, partial [Thermotogota bacterium]